MKSRSPRRDFTFHGQKLVSTINCSRSIATVTGVSVPNPAYSSLRCRLGAFFCFYALKTMACVENNALSGSGFGKGMMNTGQTTSTLGPFMAQDSG